MELVRAKDIDKAFTLPPPPPPRPRRWVEDKLPDLPWRLPRPGVPREAVLMVFLAPHNIIPLQARMHRCQQAPSSVSQMWSRHRRHSSFLHSLPQSEAHLEPADYQGGPSEWRPRYELETTDAELEVPTWPAQPNCPSFYLLYTDGLGVERRCWRPRAGAADGLAGGCCGPWPLLLNVTWYCLSQKTVH
jgi:hypothetical protein